MQGPEPREPYSGGKYILISSRAGDEPVSCTLLGSFQIALGQHDARPYMILQTATSGFLYAVPSMAQSDFDATMHQLSHAEALCRVFTPCDVMACYGNFDWRHRTIWSDGHGARQEVQRRASPALMASTRLVSHARGGVAPLRWIAVMFVASS